MGCRTNVNLCILSLPHTTPLDNAVNMPLAKILKPTKHSAIVQIRLTALVTGIVTMMFNWTMLRYVGENGVAAVTIIMYVLMFASSLAILFPPSDFTALYHGNLG